MQRPLALRRASEAVCRGWGALMPDTNRTRRPSGFSMAHPSHKASNHSRAERTASMHAARSVRTKTSFS
ncbi:MAG: hypothetical protein JWM55_770 [Acidimicrobiaceae bacterium]|nr:hypothetical protein [Acidimicrobiaceae bacterium]